MSALDEPSTFGLCGVQRSGPINLRAHHVARHVQRSTDLDAARAFITWAIIGAGIFAWGFLIVWWLTR